ncbi:hypothetical protein Vqi01_15780 [Micromonospora qiuiae]|uniref:Uncharacterized protein n=1 Tax=Micromonospora qiuiae TaxID=502268 RepID=A0ABQ4J8B2_9ACTN|nr:class 1 isoprenoid biosynthesis enzyme [Micromonospora qiuiae]GIJ26416.1 hypothetical protein Vqi01_15780 [Micromonospora qiuiae]
MAERHELLAVLRLTPLAIGWPSVYRYLRRDVDEITEVFGLTIGPLIDRSIAGTRRRREVYRILLSTSVKVCLAMSGYAQATNVAFQAHRAVLGSSFTRVYDDLFDNYDSPDMDQRLTVLFHGGPFQPRSDAESLLLALYATIDADLRGEDCEPVFSALRDMHTFQVRSRQQRSSVLSRSDLRQITRGKGGLGTTALFGLLRPGLSPEDRRLLLELGDVLQVLDDYHDVSLDRANGIATEVTAGTITLSEVAERIGWLRAEFRARWPRCRRDRLFGMLFMMLVGALVSHRHDRHRKPAGRSVPPIPDLDDCTPHRLLLHPAGNIHPASDRGTG